MSSFRQFDDAEDQFADADDDSSNDELAARNFKPKVTLTDDSSSDEELVAPSLKQPKAASSKPDIPRKAFGNVHGNDSQKPSSWGGGATVLGQHRVSSTTTQSLQDAPLLKKKKALVPAFATAGSTSAPAAASSITTEKKKSSPLMAAATATKKRPSITDSGAAAVASASKIAGKSAEQEPSTLSTVRATDGSSEKKKKKKKKRKKKRKIPSSVESDVRVAAAAAASPEKRKRGRPRLSETRSSTSSSAAAAAAAAAHAEQVAAMEATAEPPVEIMETPQAVVVPDCWIRQQVLKATSLVVQEIQSGAWPPILDNFHRLQQAAAAVEMYAMEILLPFLQSTTASIDAATPDLVVSNSAQTQQQQQQRHNRHFIAALLLLREVIMLNVETIFGHDAYADAGSNDEEDEKKVDVPPPPGSARLLQRDRQEEAEFRAHLQATGLILAAVERLNDKELSLEVTLQMEKYDTGHPEFAARLEPADGRTVCVLPPDGRAMDREENVACKVSFNCARKKHPLLNNTKKQHTAVEETYLQNVVNNVGVDHVEQEQTSVPPMRRFTVPQPNACHVSIVERKPEAMNRHE